MELNINHRGAVEICSLIEQRLKTVEEIIEFDGEVAHLYKDEIDRLNDIFSQLSSHFQIIFSSNLKY